MNARERFLNTLSYGERDRVPLIDLGFWKETIEVWHEQGLPKDVDNRNADEYFETDGFWNYYLSPEQTDGGGLCDRGMVVPEALRIGLAPFFETNVIEDCGDQEVVQIADGTRVRRHKSMGSIPLHEGYLLEDKDSWNKYYKTRLNPDSPERYPSDWSKLDAIANNPDRDHLLMLPAGSLYGWIRNWMGLEEISYLIYDDEELFEEMLETITECVCGVLKKTLERGGKYDAAFYWEDMSYNGGPLISPTHFKNFMVPKYKQINALLNSFGVSNIIVDSDGRVDDLIPHWLDAGVNCVLPFEIGTTGADPINYRKKFGRDMRMIGGFDKRILSGSTEGIDREIKRLAPLVEEGGFLPTCDHKIPPDVSMANYQHYLASAKKMWGV